MGTIIRCSNCGSSRVHVTIEVSHGARLLKGAVERGPLAHGTTKRFIATCDADEYAPQNAGLDFDPRQCAGTSNPIELTDAQAAFLRDHVFGEDLLQGQW